MTKRVWVDCNNEKCRHNKDEECTANSIVICEGNCMNVEEKDIEN